MSELRLEMAAGSLGAVVHGLDCAAPVAEAVRLAIIEALHEHRVLIDNGLVEGRVVSRRGGRVRLKITLGGPVSTRKGLNLPDSDLPFEISRKDRLDIKMAVEEGADPPPISPRSTMP